MVKKSVDSSGEKIQFRDKLRWIKVEEFGSYQYKHSLTDEEAWKKRFVCYQVALTNCWDRHPMELLPRRNLPLYKSKVEDIKKQLQFIPSVYHGLYLNLKAD